MDNEDMMTVHEVDQALAEAVEMGSVRFDGKNEQGENTYSLTAKGVTRSALMIISVMIETADSEKRDFTPQERRQVGSHLDTIAKALNKWPRPGQPGERR